MKFVFFCFFVFNVIELNFKYYFNLRVGWKWTDSVHNIIKLDVEEIIDENVMEPVGD